MQWRNSIVIQAPIDLVWQLTIDIANWPSITPTMVRVDGLTPPGPVQVGSTARVKQPGQLPSVWTVTKVEPGREFVWQTKRMGVLLTASHVLTAVRDTCRNDLILDATGPGARLLGMVFGGMMNTALETENAGFKARAESSSPA